MKKYEYDYSDIINDKGHSEFLTERGLQGWEMVSVVMIEEQMRIYWKRELKD